MNVFSLNDFRDSAFLQRYEDMESDFVNKSHPEHGDALRLVTKSRTRIRCSSVDGQETSYESAHVSEVVRALHYDRLCEPNQQVMSDLS